MTRSDEVDGAFGFDFDQGISRRQLLAGAAGSGLALGALGGYGADIAAAAFESAQIKRGGVLRVGHAGAGKAETFNPGRGSSFIDTSRQYNLYDPLVRVRPDLTFAPGLALRWTHNKNSTVWDIHLRPGVTFHKDRKST